MEQHNPDLKDGPDSEELNLNNAEKVVLLLLGVRGNSSIPGNLWLQKEVFSISKELPPLERYFEFQPHLQGPFSETLNNVVENLEFLGLAERNRRGIRLTPQGTLVFEEIKEGSNADLLSELSETKKFLNDLTKDELLVYIYFTYPEMTSESLEKEDLVPRRSSVAKRLYERDKVSLDTAADLAGLTKKEFISNLEEDSRKN